MKSVVSNFGFLLVALSLTLASCGPPWTIIRQSVANPFGASPAFVVLIDYARLAIDSHHPMSEAEYLSNKSPEQIASWEFDKATLAQRLFERLSRQARGFSVAPPGTAPTQGAFVLAVHVIMIEPGSMFRQPEARMVVAIGAPDGQVFDEVQFKVQPNMGVVFPISAKLRAMGEKLGQALGDYLSTRIAH